MEEKGVREIRNSYIKLFIYIFIIIIAGTALLRLNYRLEVGKAYFFIGEKTSGSINLPDNGIAGEYFTVELDLAITSNNGVLLTVEVDPSLEIKIPTNPVGLVEDNVIVWTLSPNDQIVRFDVKGEAIGSYNISAVWYVDDENGTVDGLLTLSETCEPNDIKYYKCSDGTNVTWCVCSAGEFSCIQSPEVNCPEIECPVYTPPYCPNGTLIEQGYDSSGCKLPSTCCGNIICEGNETFGNCPGDCFLTVIDINNDKKISKNEVLNAIIKYTNRVITDKKIILKAISLYVGCGNKQCAGIENCYLCPQDCGVC